MRRRQQTAPAILMRAQRLGAPCSSGGAAALPALRRGAGADHALALHALAAAAAVSEAPMAGAHAVAAPWRVDDRREAAGSSYFPGSLVSLAAASSSHSSFTSIVSRRSSGGRLVRLRAVSAPRARARRHRPPSFACVAAAGGRAAARAAIAWGLAEALPVVRSSRGACWCACAASGPRISRGACVSTLAAAHDRIENAQAGEDATVPRPACNATQKIQTSNRAALSTRVTAWPFCARNCWLPMSRS